MSAIAFDSGPQVGGRPPAPAPLSLVQAFANSFFELGEHWRDPIPTRGRDLLATPEGLERWLRQRDLLAGGQRVRSSDHRRALDLREGIRALAFANNGEEPSPAALRGLSRAGGRPGVVVEFGPDGRGWLAPTGRDVAGALSFIAGLVFQSMADGRWARMKACPGKDCGWVFYDRSRNRAGSWCSMAACGGRAKARAYRRRRGNLSVTVD
jgi:predicted RNA-binding Zn ribbon-like protein